jgi:tRNA-splicing ligase RtcB
MAAPAAIREIGAGVWELPRSHRPGMRVPVHVFASEPLVRAMDDAVFDQAANVATLPGIVRASCVMPDAHWGYGFPIGGVAAMDVDDGVISPGGIGFDINCGMRLVLTSLTLDEVRPRLRELVDALAARVPAGVGSQGFLDLPPADFADVLREGAQWCLRRGYATVADLERTEEHGRFRGADPDVISPRAVERGHRQIGTLGSGNHYLEIQVARPEHVVDRDLAARLGITQPNQVVAMFHCGSRGFGHQVATDYLKVFLSVMAPRYGITIPDRELACAPFRSPEGQRYFAAMQCAANVSFANRQMILHRIREVFAAVFRRPPDALGLGTVYDVSHNTAKLERHLVDGVERELADIGQPVIVGGSMETGSYLLTGSRGAAAAFFSSAHGSGRTMSRRRAKRSFRGRSLEEKMARHGIYVRSVSYSGLAEEAGAAYKDIDAVVAATAEAGLSRPVARLTPIGSIKG